ncbi:hypothetical protein [Microbacterium sp.]|uniref:hypothetical protein n=1 Tax=Microbacterium sp. TaxID=51671 RepID=UPI003A955239
MSASENTDARAVASDRRPPMWLFGTVIGLFGLFYAYAVWNAVSNLIQAVQQYNELGMPLNALGWGLWIFAALFPIVVYAIAVRIAAHRHLGHVVLVMLTGLALVAVFWLDVVAYATVNTHSLIS